MTTRRKKNNNNNKSKKVKKYINRNNTRKTNKYTNRNNTTKRYKEGGTLNNIRMLKDLTKRAKGRRGIRVEFRVAQAAADFFGDPTLVASHAAHQKKDPRAPIDIPSILSGKLPGDISVKSVARTSPGQKKYQICMGDSCRTFDSFSDTAKAVAIAGDETTFKKAAYFMAIVVRCEDEIKDKKIPLETRILDMRSYKGALFGNLTDQEIHETSIKLLELETRAKQETYEIFKRYATLEEATKAGVTAIANQQTEEISKELDVINKMLESRGAKLRVRLSIGNWFSKSGARQPRILSSFSWSAESPRAKASEAPFSKQFSEKMLPFMDKSSSNGEPSTTKKDVISKPSSSNIRNPPIFKLPTPRRSTASRASNVSSLGYASRPSSASRASAKNRQKFKPLHMIKEERSTMQSSNRLGRSPSKASSYRLSGKPGLK